MAHKTVNEEVEVFDITTFLWHTRCCVILGRPFVTLFRLLLIVVRWQNPKLTFIIWLLISLLSSVIPTGYTVIIFFVLLGVSCCLGLLHHHTQIFMKLFPDQELEASALQNYLQRSWGEEQKILDEYRKVLLKLDKIIESLNTYLEIIYSILKWERPFISFSCIMTVACTVVLLCLADLRVVIFIVNNAVLLGSGLYIRIRSMKISKVQGAVRNSSAVTPSQNELKDINSEKEECDVDKFEIVEEDDNDPMETTVLKSPGDNTVEHTNVLQKIMELRRRHQPLSGVCSGCQSSLIAILKRKYVCCNCRNQFCWRCCNQKVPKSFLGVTAPSTKNDTVLLCVSCHQQLHEKNN